MEYTFSVYALSDWETLKGPCQESVPLPHNAVCPFVSFPTSVKGEAGCFRTMRPSKTIRLPSSSCQSALLTMRSYEESRAVGTRSFSLWKMRLGTRFFRHGLSTLKMENKKTIQLKKGVTRGGPGPSQDFSSATFPRWLSLDQLLWLFEL